ncbi:aspartyl-tRNA(Asn)/glutamyl-tRNA (Gln) amidotransferase subunit C [Klebsormidium nitens]|uniref:Glutamyl-tRNA(Gln) amidotransferase subunit C, chloroplastic/mitochondrial n=1 Tax=Klebsormidium nitens TaxID=105231 RepID=A0A1Y1HQH1_KLENI|nr:aspartyl-tRNA(Asn)/glutamyl-tRNA (Gln) amidotransferase subunit C [Klebsormidium nitens]|eukprot:GAQ80884.1 aspartyl-tRNA(Asn)/glutamyl-tRNA (Gln) amidotransferase subunit C [Klebsormidium nitens]
MTVAARALHHGRALQHLTGAGKIWQTDAANSNKLLQKLGIAQHCRVAHHSSHSLGAIRQHRKVSCSAGESRRVDPPDVADLAVRARLEVSSEEIEDWTPKIGKIIDWFGQLQEIDVEGVPPALRAGGDRTGNTVQKDEPRAFGNRDALWDAVPSKEGPFIRVPKILNESTD